MLGRPHGRFAHHRGSFRPSPTRGVDPPPHTLMLERAPEVEEADPVDLGVPPPPPPSRRTEPGGLPPGRARGELGGEEQGLPIPRGGRLGRDGGNRSLPSTPDPTLFGIEGEQQQGLQRRNRHTRRNLFILQGFAHSTSFRLVVHRWSDSGSRPPPN